MSEFKFKMEDRVADRISGFKGTITGRSEHMDGAKQYLVVGKAIEGKSPESMWMEECRLIARNAGAKED